MDGVIGYVTLFAGNFAPRNWALCQGQLLSIQANSSLFAVIGIRYGGNGSSLFALPDLRGRTAVGAGQGAGLSNYELGETKGVESATLTINQMPPHSHPIQVTITPAAATTATASSPVNGVYANSTERLYSVSADAQGMPYPIAVKTQYTGNLLPFSIQQPLLVMNYIICITGVFPRRT